jgi:hypothetical protein
MTATSANTRSSRISITTSAPTHDQVNLFPPELLPETLPDTNTATIGAALDEVTVQTVCCIDRVAATAQWLDFYRTHWEHGQAEPSNF